MRARLVVFPIRGRIWCFSRSVNPSVSASEKGVVAAGIKVHFVPRRNMVIVRSLSFAARSEHAQQDQNDASALPSSGNCRCSLFDATPELCHSGLFRFADRKVLAAPGHQVRLDAASILGLLVFVINFKFEDVLSSPDIQELIYKKQEKNEQFDGRDTKGIGEVQSYD
ncbi:hypothetical protein K1719_005453 [Acacia pycnantha]|nr:hypothetical protein K1719_005453 [Acacia pycnantha]